MQDVTPTREPRKSLDGPYSGRTFEPMYLPARYPDNEAFIGIFGADLDEARALLPSDELHPVRLSAGRAAVAVSAMLFPYDIVRGERGVMRTGPSYGEMSVSVLCTYGGPAPPYLPLLNARLRDSWEMQVFVVHLPVTTEEAWEGGRVIWNAPKFVADMDFELGPDECAAHLAEGGKSILRLVARRGGITLRDRNDLVWYASKDGELLRTRSEIDGLQQMRLGRRAGRLELGDHPIADELRGIGIDTTPFAVRTYLRHSLVLPAPEIVGTARPHDGLLRETEPRHGRLVVR